MANPRIPPNLEGRLVSLERKLDTLSFTNGNTSASGMSALQVELARLHEELRNIRGSIEENRYAVDQLQRQLKLDNEDTEYRLQSLERSISNAGVVAFAGEGAFAPADGASGTTKEPLSKTPPTHMVQLVFPPQGYGSADTTNKPIIDTSKPIPDGLNFTEPREHYNYAVSLIRQKNYMRARDSFTRFIRMHEEDRLIGNAYYWLGETYYVNNDFVMAADTFRQGFEVKPNGIKAPDNLYKLAKSLLHLDRKNEACIVLEQIQKRYIDRNPEVVGLAFETQKANQCR
ncbi:MAG: tol-pal system protein YbgF [Sphaerospermopsis sp. SIO1G2]|nr:tol-pal system protein YbgF [Sphaerospermopsis sp. SIO1G2]